MGRQCIKLEIPYDGLTPIQVYRAVGGEGDCILESAYEQGKGKTSFIGIKPIATFEARGTQIEIEEYGEKQELQGDPYSALQKFSKDRKTFGMISYDAIRLKENIPDRHPPITLPDFLFHIYETVLIFYHDEQKVVCLHEGTQETLDAFVERLSQPILLSFLGNRQEVDIRPDMNNETYSALVEKAKSYIRAGDIFQVVLSRTYHAEVKASPFQIYRAIRQTSPAPYHFFFAEKDFAIMGASPELLISVQNGEVTSMPIAGTCAKEETGSDLLQNPKECAEHVMLVDLARNDLGSLAVAGSVRVTEYKSVKSFSHVHHIVSKIVGKLDPVLHSLDALKASLPAGTLSGAPKIRAMEIIDELEVSRRGLYGGAVVSLDEQGNLMSCIAIRMVCLRGSHAEIRVGAGIVLDSQGSSEARETELKMQGILEALQLAEGGVL